MRVTVWEKDRDSEFLFSELRFGKKKGAGGRVGGFGGYGLRAFNTYKILYIFAVGRVRYPPDQKLNIRCPSKTRIKKITLTVSVHIYARGRANGRTGRPILSEGSGFAGICPPLVDSIHVQYSYLPNQFHKTRYY